MKTSVMTGLKMVALAMLVGVTVFAQQVPPSAPAKVMPGYIIGPTDVLRVTVYSGGNSQEDFARNTYTVQTDGSVQLPLVSKKIVVGGKSVEEANEIIRKALLDEKVYEDVNTRVDITIADFKSSTIKVQGAVRSGGSITLKADRMNISDALNGAGGLQPSAGAEIRVKRAGNRPPPADVLVRDGWEIYSKEDLNQGRLMDVALYADDVIDVPVAPTYYVNGFVTTIGAQQWEPNLTLERAILKAGGAKSDGAVNRVSVRRLDPKTKQYVEVKLNKNKGSTLIEPEDQIFVPKKWM